MLIDLTSLLSNIVDSISINENITFNLDLLNNTNIKRIENVNLNCVISKFNDEFSINGILKGTMILPDDVTLEDVNYDFSIKIDDYFGYFDENDENNLKIINNSLDIIPFLWQNIVLEVPLKVKGPNNIKNLHGDDWRLIDEKELTNSNNALSDLKELLNKRKE